MVQSVESVQFDANPELQQFIDEVRRVVVLSVGVAGDSLGGFTRQLRDFNESLQQHYEQPAPFMAKSSAEAVSAIFNDTPAAGRYNPLGCPGELTFREGVATRRVNLPHPYHGPGNLVHGGVISLLYDDLLAMAASLNNLRAQTVSLKIDYKAPAFIQSDLEFTAWVESVDGRKVTLCGECRHSDKLLSEASALFILSQTS